MCVCVWGGGGHCVTDELMEMECGGGGGTV